MDFDSLSLWFGRILVVYCAYILAVKFLYLWKLYIAPTPVDFAEYGKWSGIAFNFYKYFCIFVCHELQYKFIFKNFVWEIKI